MKKMTLLFTILCVGQLYGMKSEKPTYEETYGSLPAELKQHILNIALAKSNDLLDAIKTIKAFSILHGVNYNLLAKSNTLKNMLINKFPTTVKNVILFALKKPEKYLQVATLLKNNLDSGINTIMEKSLLQKNLNEFTVLIHMIDDQEKSNLKRNNKKLTETTASLSLRVHIPLARKYRELNFKLLKATDSTKVSKLLNQGADINYSNHFFDVPHTALSLAAVAGNIELVTFLLEAGANPYFEIPETGTALDIVLQAIEEQKLPNYFDPVYNEQLAKIKTMLEKAMLDYFR